MKNKTLFFLILFFLEGVFSSSQAMLPMFSEKGKSTEGKITEEQREEQERENKEEQGRRISGDDHNDSNTLERGTILGAREEEKQSEESCEEGDEITKMLSMNSIVEEANNFQHLETLAAVEKKQKNTTTGKKELGDFKGTSMEPVPISLLGPLHQQIDPTIHGLKSGYQERKAAEHLGVSFTLPTMTKESSAELISTSQEFVNKTSLDFANLRKTLSKTLRSLPKNDAGQQDAEQVAAHYKKSYDQATTLLHQVLSTLETDPTLYDEQMALLLADMSIKTIQMAAQSVPLEKIKPLRGRVARENRTIKIPFEVVSERSSIIDEEGKFVADSAEYALKDLQEAKEFLKSAADYSPDEMGEKFHQLHVNRNMRIAFLLTHKTVIASLKCRAFQATESTQENIINTRAQLEQERRLAYDVANEHDQLLQELFDTPATSDLNKAKKEVFKNILNLASSRLKAADELIHMMNSRKEN